MARIVVFCISGIGNALLFTPALRLLKASGHRVTIAARGEAIASVFNGQADDLVVLGKGPRAFLRAVLGLRKERFDISITAFPSNRWEFNVLSAMVGAKTRLTHKYATGITLDFLQNSFVRANPDLHDVEQNIALLQKIGIRGKPPELHFRVGIGAKKFAASFFRRHGLAPGKTIAIHPGTKAKDSVRRWSPEKFAMVCDMLKDRGYVPLILQGPDDSLAVSQLIRSASHPLVVAKGISLEGSAALIERCRAFLGTDSGLGHIAVSRRVRSLVIFGPANPRRTTPRRPYGKWIRATCPDSPGLKYPFWSTTDRIGCPYQFQCLGNLTPRMVLSELFRHARL